MSVCYVTNYVQNFAANLLRKTLHILTLVKKFLTPRLNIRLQFFGVVHDLMVIVINHHNVNVIAIELQPIFVICYFNLPLEGFQSELWQSRDEPRNSKI